MQTTTGYLIWRVSMKWRAAVERAVSPLGLTHAQYVVLASLAALSSSGTRPSQRELADFTGLEPVFVSKLVRALEAAGFVQRAAHPADSRAVALRLTKRGDEVVGRGVGIVHDLLEELTEPIGGTAGRRNQELIKTLWELLGVPQPTEGDQDMTQTATLFGQDLGLAHRAAGRLLTTLLEREGLEFEEWVAMLFLGNEGGSSATGALRRRLVEGLDAEPTEIDRVLDKLGKRDVIAETSGRLEFTGNGRALFDRLFDLASGISTELLEGVPAEDVATTRRVLIRYARRAMDLHGRS